MEKRQAYLELLTLVNHVLSGSEIPAGLDWEQVALLAKRHNLIGFVYRSLAGRSDIPAELVERIETGYFTAVGGQVRQEHYAAALFRALRERGIRYMPMKGYVLRRLYPQPTWRISCDLDVLLDAEHRDEVREILSGYGFACEPGNGETDLYTLDSVNITVRLNGDGTLWESLLTEDGMEYRYTDEDFYLEMLAFMRAQLLSGAGGVRAVLDLYIYRHAKTDMDGAYLAERLAARGMTRFAESMSQLAEVWFGGAQRTDDMMLLGSFIAAGGSYGKSGSLAEPEDEGKPGFLRAMFPPYRIMKRRYLVLKRVPFLLPFFWVVRWFSLLFSHGHDRQAEQIMRNTNDRSAKMVERVREITGLID